MSCKVPIHLVLQNITGKWFIPILTEISTKGERFTPLQTKLNISPARLSENLKKLCALGLVKHLSPIERRHPLLPEYVLSESGSATRQLACEMLVLGQRIGDNSIWERRWLLAVLMVIYSGENKFSAIKRNCKPITSKSLSKVLLDLQEKNWIKKIVVSEHPVDVMYEIEDHILHLIKAFLQKVGSDDCTMFQ